MRRRHLLAAGAALPGVALAQEGFPTRPVRLVVAFAAGGAGDTVARLVQPVVGEALGQPLVVENRTGAGGTIGGVAVARSQPDGYTLLLDGSGHVMAPRLQPNLPIDYATSFTYVGRLTTQPYALVVHAQHPARSMAEFVAWARREGPVIFGTPGIGSSGHLSLLMMGQQGGCQVEHAPYRGGGEVINAIVSGSISVACTTVGSAKLAAETGRARILGVSTAQRATSLPEVPSFAETGFPDIDITSWIAIFGPAGIPAPALGVLSRAFASALADPAVQSRLLAAGYELGWMGPDRFSAYVAQQRAMFGGLMAQAGL